MAAEAKTQKAQRDRGRRLYRFTASQVMEMVKAGILGDGERVELWDGVVYRMTKGPEHNFTVSATAAALRAVVPAGYHVAEEKSSRYDEHSLPEPDVAVVRGALRDYTRRHPELSAMALLVEVCHHSARADYGVKLRRYAEAGVPVYWVVNVEGRTIEVCSMPAGSGKGSCYADRRVLTEEENVSVVVDGGEVGRFAVADLLP